MSKSREDKLEDYKREHRILDNETKELKAQKKPIENRLRKVNSRKRQVGLAIYDLKHNGNTPEITDHAIVRYLQRVEGVDINELKLKVATDKNAIRIGGVIVTVNEEII